MEQVNLERPAAEWMSSSLRAPLSAKAKNLHSTKTENEGIQQLPRRTRGTGWPHPSLDGEVGHSRSFIAPEQPRRAQPNRYPDSGS
jgi:hypothetical protein